MEGLYNWYKSTIRNPKYRWWIILGTVAYLLLPFDILPDFIPVVGQIDDALVVTLLFAEVSQMLLSRVQSKKGSQPTEMDATETRKTEVDVTAVPIE